MKKIYVGNISYKASEDDVKELFSQFGEVNSVKLITDAYTGQPRGFGFIEMTSEEEAAKAITNLNGTTFMDRSLSVAEAKTQRSDRGGFRGNQGPGKGRR